jgi:hypothetical protein
MNRKEALKIASKYVYHYRTSQGYIVVSPWNDSKPDALKTEKYVRDYKSALKFANIRKAEIALQIWCSCNNLDGFDPEEWVHIMFRFDDVQGDSHSVVPASTLLQVGCNYVINLPQTHEL